MTSPLQNGFRGGFKTAAAQPRAVEKTSASSALGANRRDGNNREDQSPPRLQVEIVCQDKTEGFDPFWDGPRLLPIFVAQLLGQAMPERRENHALAQTAYGSAAPRMALLVDCKS